MDIEEDVDELEIYKPIEICSLLDEPNGKNNQTDENFFRGCKWAPDGTCLLTNSNDNHLRTFDLPSELHCKSVWRPSNQRPKLNYTLKIKEGGIIYDYVWYPKTSSTDGFTSYFLCSSMYAPIHLWDSVGGEIKATYRPYNQVDEVTHAYSLAFSLDGNKIYAGFLSEVKIFSTDRPGRECVSRNLKPWFRKNIVSAIAINPVHPDICALGTYSKIIGLFSDSDGRPLFFLKGHNGGITHLEFSSNGILLFSGARKDCEIICWDLRNPGCILHTFPRQVSTNQRVYFDLTSCSNYLLSGNTNGDLSIWNVNTSNLPSSPYEESVQEPLYKFSAHQDCTNGVSVHPFYPILGTTSGQRHVSLTDQEEIQQVENNLKLWWIGR
ncbi:hypothetical protein M8J76_005275 [Diaphorina citri]|nr:hypothetical protein M8J75_011066 [Diaphorina citri]KAI5749183.1 hypothetical protein M8J76_005275 [Diaphorina citri]